MFRKKHIQAGLLDEYEKHRTGTKKHRVGTASASSSSLSLPLLLLTSVLCTNSPL